MWNEATITNRGLAVYNRWLGGEALTLTGAKGGDRVTDNPAAATDLARTKQTLTLAGTEAVSGGQRVKVRALSVGLETGYTLRQMGIWGRIGSETPVLLILLQDADGVAIPSQSENADFVLELSAFLQAVSAGSFSAVIDPDALATRAAVKAIVAAEAAARAAADEEIHQHLTSPYNFKGSLASAAALPEASAANANDTYYLIAEKYRVTSNGTAWEQSSMEESQYTDELAEVKSAINNGKLPKQTTWEVGKIDTSTGENAYNTKTYRTAGYLSTADIDYVECLNASCVCLVFYYSAGQNDSKTFEYYMPSAEKHKINKYYDYVRICFNYSDFSVLPALSDIYVYTLTADTFDSQMQLNISSITWELGSLKSGTGAEATSTTRVRSKYIKVTEGSTVKLCSPAQSLIVYCYDIGKNYLSDSAWSDGNTFTVPQDVFYIRILIRNGATNPTITQDQMDRFYSELDILLSFNKAKYLNFTNEEINEVLTTSGETKMFAADGFLSLNPNSFTRSRWYLYNGALGRADASYRVSPSAMTLDFDVVFSVNDPDYSVYGYETINSSYSYFKASYSKQSRVIKKGTEFVFSIKKVDEDTSETADIATFVSKVNIFTEFAQTVFKTTKPPVDILPANEDAVNKILASRWLRSSTAKPLSLLWFSDIHRWETPLKRIIEVKEYLKSLGVLNDAIVTGDIVRNATDESTEFQAFWYDTPGTKDILIALGNHDHYDVGTQPHGKATLSKMNSMFFQDVANWDVVRESNYPFYYKDYANQRIRLIVADPAVTSDEADETTWLQTTLAGAKTLGYAVVVAAHFLVTESATIYDNGWSNNLARAAGSDSMSYDWNNGCDIVSCVTDFIADGGTFICYMIGHTHTDIVSYVTGHSDQLIINVACASDDRTHETSLTTNDLPRYDGTRTQDCFNVITFDAENSLIKCVRVGANMNMYQIPRTAFAYNYLTKQFISVT